LPSLQEVKGTNPPASQIWVFIRGKRGGIWETYLDGTIGEENGTHRRHHRLD
jgi:hypothetical protein